MIKGEVIWMFGGWVEVIDWTETPIDIMPADKKDGAPMRVQLATVRELAKPQTPGARDRR